MKRPTTKQFQDAARKLYHDPDNDLEIDANPAVSKNNEGGAWVAAWIYVRDEDARS